MMEIIKSLGCTITIGTNCLKLLTSFLKKAKYTSYFIICDTNTLQHCLPILIMNCPLLKDAEIIELESGEESKSLEFTAHVWQTLIENNADKKTLIINLGGGVVCDLGGFCASTYKRGIDFINIPTSLLAMVDASVGGKNGIDFCGVKNPIGTYSQPKQVFINSTFLKTLPMRHYQNGLAEVYKIALISDKKFWNELKLSGTKKNENTIIAQSVTLKNKLVLKDPFDKGIRRTLNFGHTVGHGIESLFLGSKEELLHGESILVGMIIESYIAFQKKLISKKEFDEVVLVFKTNFNVTTIKHINFEEVLALIKNDKKNLKNKLQFALIQKIGGCMFDVPVSEAQLKKGIAFYLNQC